MDCKEKRYSHHQLTLIDGYVGSRVLLGKGSHFVGLLELRKFVMMAVHMWSG